jgi:hypothetical protein
MVVLKVVSMMKRPGFAILTKSACACQNTISVLSRGVAWIMSTTFSCVYPWAALPLSADCRGRCVTRLVSCARINSYNADVGGRRQAMPQIHAMGSACERIIGA